jgi:ribosomal protein S18 acetylase RimI-like enzyme
MLIRVANIEDTKNIAVLKQQVWIATYAVDGIRNEFSNYALRAFTPKNIRSTIQDKNRIILIAENNNHLVGHVEIALNEKCPVELENDCPEIAVLYVLERFMGKGIGKMLLHEAIEKIKELGYKSTWLTVYHKNHKALEFYQRNHFIPIGFTNFVMDGNRYENKVMILELDKLSLK